MKRREHGITGAEIAAHVEVKRELARAIRAYLRTPWPRCGRVLARLASVLEHGCAHWDALVTSQSSAAGLTVTEYRR